MGRQAWSDKKPRPFLPVLSCISCVSWFARFLSAHDALVFQFGEPAPGKAEKTPLRPALTENIGISQMPHALWHCHTSCGAPLPP